MCLFRPKLVFEKGVVVSPGDMLVFELKPLSCHAEVIANAEKIRYFMKRDFPQFKYLILANGIEVKTIRQDGQNYGKFPIVC